jgi:hypothetical protein
MMMIGGEQAKVGLTQSEACRTKRDKSVDFNVLFAAPHCLLNVATPALVWPELTAMSLSYVVLPN